MSDKYPGGFVTANAPAGFSVAFDGTGDYLSTSTNAAFAFGTGNFTIEAWVYVNAQASFQNFVDTRTGQASSATGVYFGVNSGALTLVFYKTGATLTSTSSITAATWTHVALVRSGTTVTIYINGVASGTVTDSTNFTDNSFYAGNSLAGYMSNVRINKGTAVYTANFTPPTQMFPISGTSILTCQSPTIIDNSTNNFTITVNGNATVSNFTPFAAYTGFNPALGAAAGGVWTLDEAAYYQNNRQWPIYDPYFKNTTLMLHGNGTNGAQNNTFLDSSSSPLTITRNGNTTQGSFSPFSQTGWSNYFSTSPFLTVASNTAFDFGSGDATQEMWIYPTTASQTGGLFDKRSIGANYSQFPQIAIESGVLKVYVSYTGSSWAVQITGATPTPNAWTHIALVRYGNTWTLYVNGVVSGTPVVASGSVYASTNNLCIGAAATDGSNPYTGYISNVRIVKGTALYTSNFTPSTAPLTAATGTSLLTCQSNRFVDNSANNFSITLNSTVSVQAFSPFVPAYITPTTYSGFFGATTGKLSIASMTALGSDFTVEGWINPSAFADYNTIWDNRTSDADASGFALGLTAAKKVYFYTNASFQLTTTTALNASTWYHIALVRSGSGSGNVKIYINGIADATTATYTTSFTRTAASIACDWNTRSNLQFFGCISNFRTLTTALYTANFTPPTAPLTAIANTTLLTCQSSTFIDNSGNSVAITVSGTAYPVTSPTPFPAKVDTTTLNSAYSTSLIGGSGYFDGTGDYLQLADSTAWDLTGDYTIEMWLYSTATPVSTTFFQIGDTSNYLIIYLSSATKYITTTGSLSITASTALALNSWNHMALVRSGSGTNNTVLYLNGVNVGQATNTTSFTGSASNGVRIGAEYPSNYYFNGYIAGNRIVKGTAVYTSNFTPPTAPPTAVTNTQLLTNFTNAGIYDSTAKNVLETVGNAQISTTQSKWGGTSMYFDGTGDYLKFPNSSLLQFGTGDFTFEAWIYPTNLQSAKAGEQSIIDTNAFLISVWNNNVHLAQPGVADLADFASSGITNNTWAHLVISRSGTSLKCFVNGTQAGSTLTNSTNFTSSGSIFIGAFAAPSNYYIGYIDDLRITKGVARYITNFTPPTSQLQDQ